METIEIFSGTESFSKVARNRGHNTFTIDNNEIFNSDLEQDFLEIPFSFFKNKKWGVAWFSPPCKAFSVCTIGRNWKERKPYSENAKYGISLLERSIKWISIIKPKQWYIENPRGMMRVIIDDLFKKYGIKDYRRVTVTYCQYGDSRMKPTDIWTNNKTWIPRPMCKNGAPCHIASPRGTKSGTQGLKNAAERGKIPEQIFLEIFNH